MEGQMGIQRFSVGKVLIQRLSMALAVGVLSVVVPLGQSTIVQAATVRNAVAPRAIALTLADLPRGFAVDPEYTKEGYINDVGPSMQVQFEREATVENLRAGPVLVGQLIVRHDGQMGAGDALKMLRRFYMEERGFSLNSDGPNDGGTFTLQKTDGDFQVIMVGFVKENMIIMTMTGGARGMVYPEIALKLAGMSSAKLDAAAGR
jgi:hypothetical protein